MNQELYKKVEQFVIDSFNKTDFFNEANKISQIKHFIRTVHWVKELRPDADEALLISAVAHDIERAFRKKDVLEKKKSAKFSDLDWLRIHEERGAEIVSDFLKQQGADDEIIERVKMLVSRHEEGGNDDQNTLKDADSLSFFENNIPLFLTEVVGKVGKERVREKFDWMYNRITSEKAKQIALPWYKEAIAKLN